MYRWMVVCVTVLLAVPAWATTRYVSAGGHGDTPSDTLNSCAASATITTPKRNLGGVNGAIACMIAAGDILYVRGGTYTESEPLRVVSKISTGAGYTISGYQSEVVTLAPSNGSRAIIVSSSSFIILTKMVLDGVSSVTGAVGANRIENSNNITISNLDIKNWNSVGILVATSNDVIIRNNLIHDQVSNVARPCPGLTRYYGIYHSDGNNLLVEGNDIYNNPGGGMQIYPSPTNSVIRGNKIHDNNTCGPFDGTNGSLIGGILTGGATGVNTQIYNNLIYRNGLTTGVTQAHCVTVYAPGTSVRIWNNTCYNNYNQIVVLNGSVNTVISNNIDTAYLALQSTGGTNTIRSYNACTSTESCGSTGLVTITGLTQCTVSTTDFHLRSGTNPCVNSGTSPLASIPTLTTDYDGVARPQGVNYDIGAYEFVSTDVTAPAAPTGLTVN